MKKAVVFLFLSLLFCQAFASYKARITQLNSKKEYFLSLNTTYYFQLIGKPEVYKLPLKEIQKNALLFGDMKVDPAAVSFISLHRHKNNFISSIRRNANRNLGILPAPSFDFETTHLLEIISDDSQEP